MLGSLETLRIPIPRAGPSQIRFAVRDRASGKFGTAGEFIDLPDVAHGAFALSGIMLRSDDDRAASARPTPTASSSRRGRRSGPIRAGRACSTSVTDRAIAVSWSKEVRPWQRLTGLSARPSRASLAR
jgi:hypothetical protein